MPEAIPESNWRRIEDLFYAAIDLEPAMRHAFLDGACGEDLKLKAEIDSLLRSSQETLGFARNAILHVAKRETTEVDLTGTRIGAYQLLRVIGRGGMGTVYLAARADDLYQQNVAIKLMDAGFAQAENMRARFSAERQILANLNHPNIARLLDGGITEGGLPYLVMEHVDGLPIDEFCRRSGQSTEGLLKLFVRVCAAVEYAHHNLVIHRDIKPGNILVTPEGVPKLLDFGISKLLDRRSSNPDLGFLSEWIMTPEYAGPEQISGGPITTSTDVYALGVLLYELFSGARPFATEHKSLSDVFRAIRNQVPEPPSKVRREVSQSGYFVDFRRFREDIDSIVLKAVRKEPERRYASVAEFADDLRRTLEDYPVRARADDWNHRAKKFVRRHTVAVGSGLVAAAALICFSIGMGVLAKQEAEARSTADQQRAAAQKEADFLSGIFQAATPEMAKGREVTARELLDAAASRIDGDLASAPQVKATMLDDLGRAYTDLGLYSKAEPPLEHSYQLRQGNLELQTLEGAATVEALGRLYRLQGDYKKAEPLFRQALSILRRNKRPNDPEIAESLNDLGECLYWEGHDLEAEEDLRQALAIDREPDTDLGAMTRDYLALVLERKGDFDDANELLRKASEISEKTQGKVSPIYAIILQNLGGALTQLGDFPAAESAERRALEIRRKLSGDEHPDTAYTLNNVGWILLAEGDWSQAKPFLREALGVRHKLLGEHHPLYAASLANWARVLQAQGDYAGADRFFQSALKILRENGRSDNWTSAQILYYLSLLNLDRGRFSEAERYAKEALEIQQKVEGNAGPEVASSLYALAIVKESQGELTAAEALLRSALDIRKRKLRPGHASLISVEARLGSILVHENHLDLAESFLVEAEHSAHSSRNQPLPWVMAEVDIAMGSYLMKRGKISEGQALLQHAVPNLTRYPEVAMRRQLIREATELGHDTQLAAISTPGH